MYNWGKAVCPASRLNSQVSFSKKLSRKTNFVEVALHLQGCYVDSLPLAPERVNCSQTIRLEV